MTVAEFFSGGPIRIEVTETNHAQCKLGVAEPREVTILRE